MIATQQGLFDVPSVSASSAKLSECGRYRYSLERRWAPGPMACWLMLNPSTADASQDDPTIRRCISFAKLWGCGGLVVVNIFPLRATDPRELKKARARGEDILMRLERDHHIEAAAKDAKVIVAAWGAHKLVGKEATRLPRCCTPLQCLGTNQDGSPKHPLYVKGDTELRVWR